MAQTKSVYSWQSFMCLHLNLLDIDHPLTFELSKLGPIEAPALIYLRGICVEVDVDRIPI